MFMYFLVMFIAAIAANAYYANDEHVNKILGLPIVRMTMVDTKNELLVLTYMLLAVWPVVLFAGALVAAIFGIHMVAKVIGEEISKKVRF